MASCHGLLLIVSCVAVVCGVVWCGVVWCGVVWCGRGPDGDLDAGGAEGGMYSGILTEVACWAIFKVVICPTASVGTGGN